MGLCLFYVQSKVAGLGSAWEMFVALSPLLSAVEVHTSRRAFFLGSALFFPHVSRALRVQGARMARSLGGKHNASAFHERSRRRMPFS